MPNKLDVVSRMTGLDAIHADGIAIGGIARLASVEIVHREGGIRGDLVQALTVRHCLLHSVLVVENLYKTNTD